MATSIVKLYNNQLLKAENNNMFSETATNSNFEYYLEHNSINKIVINDFQYIKHELNLIIKIDKEQSQINKTDSSQWTYCSIKNSDDTRTYYYYIVGMSWRAKSTIAIQLSMDTIATFWYEIQNSLDDDTNVIREHRDRFYYIDGQLHENDILIRKIDPISEGIQVDNKKMIQDKPINDDNIPLTINKWYLIYRTEVNSIDLSDIPIKCYLCSDKDINLQANGVNYLDTKQLNKQTIYYFCNESFNGNGGVAFQNNLNENLAWNLNDKNTGATVPTTCRVIKVFYDNDVWKISALAYTDSNNNYNTAGTRNATISTGNTIIELTDGMTKGYSLVGLTIDENNDYYQYLYYGREFASVIYVNGGTVVWKSIKSVDRTMSNLNTIIELPYCPSDEISYDTVNHIYNYDSSIWEWSNEFDQLKLIDLNSEFYRNLVQQYQIPDMVYNIKESEIATVTNNNILESKIYHSDFSQLKYVYDSFSMTLDRERVNVTSDLTTAPEMGIGYKQSNNITSNLLFDIKFDGQDTSYKKLGDIDPIILATRNNEVTIYQDAYINYMRTGYNYDKKAKTISNTQQAINFAGSVGQSILSGGVGIRNLIGINPNISRLRKIAEESNQMIGYNLADINKQIIAGGLNESIGSAMAQHYLNSSEQRGRDYSMAVSNKINALGAGTQLAISNSFSIVGTISNAIATRQQQENSMNAKLAELQSQSASTVGSNDLNLLNYYNGNKLHEMKYEISDSMKKPIFDMFYYLGYTTNLQKKPDLYTRHVFNYIMCEPEFKPDGRVIFNEYLMDIKARFASGLTIWHDETINDYGCNNIEKWIFDHYMWPQEEV